MEQERKKGKMRVLICETAVSPLHTAKYYANGLLENLGAEGAGQSPLERCKAFGSEVLIKGVMILVSTVQNTASCCASHLEMLNTLRSRPGSALGLYACITGLTHVTQEFLTLIYTF